LGSPTAIANVEGGEAQRLVACAYGACDLFGSEADTVGWSKHLRADRPADRLLPAHFAPASAGALMGHLRDAGVARADGGVDEYRLWQFQQVIALLPLVRIEEQARRPPERRCRTYRRRSRGPPRPRCRRPERAHRARSGRPCRESSRPPPGSRTRASRRRGTSPRGRSVHGRRPGCSDR